MFSDIECEGLPQCLQGNKLFQQDCTDVDSVYKMVDDAAAGVMNNDRYIGYVAMQDNHGYDYLAKCHFREADAQDPAARFTMHRISLTFTERYVPGSMPMDLEMNTPVLPRTWLRLCSAAMRNIELSSAAATVHLALFVSKVNGNLQRAEWVESCFDQCEGVMESICFLRSGQSVKAMMGGEEVSFVEVVRAAFAGVLTADRNVDDEKLSRCLFSWQWVSEKETRVQKSLGNLARL